MGRDRGKREEISLVRCNIRPWTSNEPVKLIVLPFHRAEGLFQIERDLAGKLADQRNFWMDIFVNQPRVKYTRNSMKMVDRFAFKSRPELLKISFRRGREKRDKGV